MATELRQIWLLNFNIDNVHHSFIELSTMDEYIEVQQGCRGVGMLWKSIDLFRSLKFPLKIWTMGKMAIFRCRHPWNRCCIGIFRIYKTRQGIQMENFWWMNLNFRVDYLLTLKISQIRWRRWKFCQINTKLLRWLLVLLFLSCLIIFKQRTLIRQIESKNELIGDKKFELIWNFSLPILRICAYLRLIIIWKRRNWVIFCVIRAQISQKILLSLAKNRALNRL